MKLRITTDQFRLRLEDHEVKQLSEGKSIFLTAHFGSGSHPLNCELLSTEEEDYASISHVEGSFRVIIPHDEIVKWAESDQEGIYHSHRTEMGSQLQICVEKDYPCKH